MEAVHRQQQDGRGPGRGLHEVRHARTTPSPRAFTKETFFMHLSPCCSKCGPQTSSLHITWELVRNAKSQAQPQTH